MKSNASISHLLDLFYSMPDPMDTQSQWETHSHHDLQVKTRAELLFEHERLRNRLLLDPRPHPWLRERIVAIREAIRRVR